METTIRTIGLYLYGAVTYNVHNVSENNKLIHLIDYCTKYTTATAELHNNIVIHFYTQDI